MSPAGLPVPMLPLHICFPHSSQNNLLQTYFKAYCSSTLNPNGFPPRETKSQLHRLAPKACITQPLPQHLPSHSFHEPTTASFCPKPSRACSHIWAFVLAAPGPSCSFPRWPCAFSLPPFRSGLMPHLLTEVFPNHLILKQPLGHSSPLSLDFSFPCGPYCHSTLHITLFLY